MASIEFKGVTKSYDGSSCAVSKVDLDIHDGEFVVLVGPSGCGKTTLLRMLAGLESVTSGDILIDGTSVRDAHPRDRNIAMVFQGYALYPHMSVFENMAFPLRNTKLPKAEVKSLVTKAATMLGLDQVLSRRPRMLSGGQRQRVAIGRAIVREPMAFLMDEPLSNLDAKLRAQTRIEIAELQRDLRATTLYVTHDQTEAMAMGDRVAVLRGGVLQQFASGMEVYDDPANLFVATFIGSPAMNTLRGQLERKGDALVCRVGAFELEISAHMRDKWELDAQVGRDVAVGIRPEHLSLSAVQSTAEPNVISGKVRLVEALGSESIVHLEVMAERVVSEEVLEIASDMDQTAADQLRAERSANGTSVIAKLDAHCRALAGERITLCVASNSVLYFDLATGRSLRRPAEDRLLTTALPPQPDPAHLTG